MKKIKEVFVLLLIAAVVSLCLAGCKDKSEPAAGEQPTSEHPTEEHPTEEHPTEEHPKSEHPTSEHPE